MATVIELRHRASAPAPALRRRATIVAGALASGALVLALVPPSAPPIEAALLMLLRFMAVLKGGMALAVLAAVTWRAGRPLPWPVAVGYALGSSAMVAAVAALWQLQAMPAAIVAFYGALATAIAAAWVDGELLPARA